MTDRETIHSDFETIKRENNNYRISTYVKYRIPTDDYVCTALLYKSIGGTVTKRDLLYEASDVTADDTEIDQTLTSCIEECREKMNDIEDAKSMLIDVSIDG